MRFYIITGEESGDLHASNLVKELKQERRNLRFRGFGGGYLRSAGVDIALDIKNTSFMGFIEVIENLSTIQKNIRFCKKDILEYKPAIIILVDYAGFNLRIARFAKKHAIKVIYYIPPKIWAWNSRRIKVLQKYVDKILAIFPFEEDIYKKNQMDVSYVGNPLLDEIQKHNHKLEYSTQKKIIALLPGSREQEIKYILPQMLKIIDRFSDYQFVLAATDSFTKDFYHSFIGNHPVEVVFNHTYSLLSNSYAALVTSGTATLETALFKVPQIVCYKTNIITYLLAKSFIKTKFISLVNILMNKLVIKELIQGDLNVKNLEYELKQVLEENSRKDILDSYNQLEQIIGKEGASRKAAEEVLSFIK